ncbi:MAG: cation diffusion facilitator family transporter [bacterium]
MEHDHDHDHDHGGHDHAKGASSRALAITLALTIGFLLAEVIGSWLFSSLALLSDAAHMFTDAAALAIAMTASRIATLAPDAKRTYGYRRFEVLAAAFNASLLVFAAGWILFESLRRLFSPVEVTPLGMFAIAAAGLVVNLIGMRVLSAGRDESLNMKGAYLEVWADAVGSIGVIAGAALIWLTSWTWIDPVIAVAIALWVLPRSWSLLSDSTHILMQGVPRGTDLSAIRNQLAGLDGVSGVHDLHCWSVSGDDVSLTAHLVLAPGAAHDALRGTAVRMLEQEFDIHHVTLQTEDQPCEAEVTHA